MLDIETTMIVYPLAEGNSSLAIISPNPTCGLTVEEIAEKDTPSGVPFKYIDKADIPEDMTFRNAWEVDFSASDGFGIGAVKWFAAKGIAV
jgi:hypothetical protein